MLKTFIVIEAAYWVGFFVGYWAARYDIKHSAMKHPKLNPPT